MDWTMREMVSVFATSDGRHKAEEERDRGGRSGAWAGVGVENSQLNAYHVDVSRRNRYYKRGAALAV